MIIAYHNTFSYRKIQDSSDKYLSTTHAATKPIIIRPDSYQAVIMRWLEGTYLEVFPSFTGLEHEKGRGCYRNMYALNRYCSWSLWRTQISTYLFMCGLFSPCTNNTNFTGSSTEGWQFRSGKHQFTCLVRANRAP